jgi:hypothetical protein
MQTSSKQRWKKSPIITVAGVIEHQKPEIKPEIPVINIPAEGKQLLKLAKKHLKAKGN